MNTRIEINDGGYSSEYVLEDYCKNVILIGRSSDCDIKVRSDLVSAKHGCFYRENNSWRYKDMHSKNGSFKEEKKIISVLLRRGIRVNLGTPRMSENGVWFITRSAEE